MGCARTTRKEVRKTVGETTSTTTRVAYILDKSGSMASCRKEAIQGTNEYLKTLRDEDPETRISVTLFDTEVYHLFSGVPVREVTDLKKDYYVPGGSTALFDAVGTTVSALESQVGEGDIVVVTIFTDGEENASSEFSRHQIFDLIRNYEQKGWTFLYLAANEEAWAAGPTMGIAQDRAVRFSVRQVDQAAPKLGRLQNYFVRRRKEDPDAQFAFSAPSIEEEPEPEDLPDNQWKQGKPGR